jgi:lipoprotein-releasing system ATP-binding protein
MNNILELKSISKSYEQGPAKIEVIKNVNLSVKPAELVAIVGSSGSGKSTLLHIAGLLDRNYAGEVLVSGLCASKSSAGKQNALRLNKIGFIYQYHHLLKDFNARENVAMPRLIAGLDYTQALKDADELLTQLGLQDRLMNFPGALSGGEQQRVAIARSMINNPDIIFADEPTGNLDHLASDKVIELFLGLAKERGLAAVIVTHNHEIAKKMNRMFELKDGVLRDS